MPKLKTHKATAKRFLIKKSRKGTKILKRADGQNHFNARESGNATRNKRRDVGLTNTKIHKTIIRALPHA